MRIPADTLDALLDAWPVGRLATLGADGAPHQVPIVFARAERLLWSPVDGKPKSGRELARVRNVRARSAVSLLLDRYDADWSRLWWIRVDARASLQSVSDPAADAHFAAAVAALRAKYPQYAETPILSGRPTLIRFEPRAVESWCPGPEPPSAVSGPGEFC